MDALSYTQWNPSILRKRIIINVNTHYKFSLVFVCDLWDYGNYQPSIAWPMPIMFIKSNKNRNVRTRVAFISLIKTSDNSIHHVVPCTFFPCFLFHSLFYFSVFTKKKTHKNVVNLHCLALGIRFVSLPVGRGKGRWTSMKCAFTTFENDYRCKEGSDKIGMLRLTATNLNSPIES